MGAVYDVELLANLKITSINPDDFWDSRSDNIDTWNDIDADDLSETNAELYSRSTNDDPSGSPTYGTWEPFANSQNEAVASSSKLKWRPATTRKMLWSKPLA